MIKRIHYQIITNRIKEPRRFIQVLLGPRQIGKSTLIDQVTEDLTIPHTTYQADAIPGATAEWISDIWESERMKMATNHESERLLVIDEIQKCPELLDEIHFLIEERNIRFLLTGSSARKLKNTGVNLLGGRATQRRFHPFNFAEIGFHENYNLPFIFEHGLLPSMFLSENLDEDLAAYIDTYLTEEIAAEGAARNIPAFARFLTVASLTNSQILNYTNIANDSNLPVQTVRQWYDVLTDTLLGYQVPPFTKTVKRKAISTAKFYFFDIFYQY